MSKLRFTPQTFRVALAFLSVYLIWGSTYFAIRIALDTLPPFLMAAVRFLVAGVIMYVILRARGAERPKPIHWLTAVVLGALLLLAGNGGVVWAEQFVASGLVALLVAMVPIWIALLDWVRPGGKRPPILAIVGLVFGFGGVIFLVGPTSIAGGAPLNLLGVGVVMLGSLCWSIGSLYSRTAAQPTDHLLGAGMQTLAGGVLLLVAAALTGEFTQIHFERVSLNSYLALGYLIVFGSIIAFTAYVWLLHNVSASRVSTYAFVNPMVAVFLGWAFRGETVTPRTLIAAAAIIIAVMFITAARSRSSTAPVAPPTDEAPLPPVLDDREASVSGRR